MKDLMGMMKAAGEMKAKMEAFQAELADLIISGSAGGGLVSVSLNGKGEMRGLKIDPTLFKEDDVEVLEDLIVTAHNDAKGRLEVELNTRMQQVTAGLPIPPGMKFPF